MGGIEFLKGHGTQNDFVVLPDVAGRLELTEERIAALCDRRRGLGADGVLRVVRGNGTNNGASSADWFMDYRNADGSVAEMCGNGLRLFARYLADSGLETRRDFVVGTRAGDRAVHVHPDNSVTVAMGPATVYGASVTSVAGREFSGIAVDVGNPHLVSFTDDVTALDLREQPHYDAGFFPEGVNLEFVTTRAPQQLRMRVYERGSGETRACGTGTVAAVAAALHTSGTDVGEGTVETPGGRVDVAIEAGSATLTGPAEFVAHGELAESWWSAR